MEPAKIITFDPSLKEEILSMFGKVVNDNGYIVERDNPEQLVLSPDGNPVTLQEFAGLAKGSLRFVKSDIVSLLQFANDLI